MIANTDAPPIQSFIKKYDLSNKIIYSLGTPVPNLMIELCTMQRYLQYSGVKEEIEGPFSQANILKEKELDYGK